MDKILKQAKEIVNSMTREQKIQFLISCVENNYKFMYNLFSTWRLEHTNASEKDAVAQCLLQIILCNTKSILHLFNGLEIIPNNDTRIIDPVSMVSILRTIYERTYIFHNIFVQPESLEERTILFNLWQIRGFNNRQNIKHTPSKYKEKKVKEKQQIIELRKDALRCLNLLRITENSKETIIKELECDLPNIKGYCFVKNKDGIITEFKSISLTVSPVLLFNDERLAGLYTLFSMHSHPSFLGVPQFGQMFNEDTDKDLQITILESLLIFHSKFIEDFTTIVEGAKDIMNKISV